jgi:hypothetical protein
MPGERGRRTQVKIQKEGKGRRDEGENIASQIKQGPRGRRRV